MELKFSNEKDRMVLPFMAPFYDGFAQPLAWVGFRALIGLALVYEGWPKIQAPFAQVGFVENLHFYPGVVWSPVLAVMQFVGGLMLAAGLLTRPIALANAVMLAITLWFHHTHPYGEAFLTPEGIALVKSAPQAFTPAGLLRIADGGGKFLDQVQEKAEMLSLIWTGGAAFFAAFGGGPLSLDRKLFKKEI